MFVHLADQADAFSLSEGQFYLQVSLEGILGYCIAILQHLVCGRLDGLGNLIGRQNLHIISWEDAQPAMVFPLQPVLVHFLMDIDNVTLLQRQLLGGLCLEVKLEPGGLPLLLFFPRRAATPFRGARLCGEAPPQLGEVMSRAEEG